MNNKSQIDMLLYREQNYVDCNQDRNMDREILSGNARYLLRQGPLFVASCRRLPHITQFSCRLLSVCVIGKAEPSIFIIKHVTDLSIVIFIVIVMLLI